MRAAAAAAVLFGLSASVNASPAVSSQAASASSHHLHSSSTWNHIKYEWVTVTKTSCGCDDPTGTATVLPNTPIGLESSVATPRASSQSRPPTASIARNDYVPYIANMQTELPYANAPEPTYTATWSSTPAAVPTTATLRPAIIAGENLANPQNVKPKPRHKLFYADTSKSSMFSSLQRESDLASRD